MDGLLLNTEDLYTVCINIVLAKYGRPPLPWSIKARLQGRPGPQSNAIFNQWAELPITETQFLEEYSALQREYFPTAQPLPGVEKLLQNLQRTRHWELQNAGADAGHRVHIALATSSNSVNFAIKTSHLQDLFSVFPAERRVLGDDTRVAHGRGKPLPDIYFLALKTINDTLPADETPIKPEECLVFEDSVIGVEAGRRAGMQVAWVPHPMLKKEYAGREAEVLAGLTGEAGEGHDHQLGELNDGWASYLPDLVDFPYEKYGLVLPPGEVEQENPN